uniref:Pkinase_Tyr domain-containing protein n=1 Tax=Heterorhabditis bacteriophora TaxID=37862 RepID=A0A1I7X427_HETBA
MRRKKSTEKTNIFEQDIKRELIITHMGNKTATDIYPTQTFLSQYVSNQYASDKTTSTSVSSKSTSSNFKHSPPTWNDFHFPPPPETPEERIYAEPCMTLPLLPTQRNLNITKPMNCQTMQRSSNSKTLDKVDRLPNSSLRFGSDLGEGKFTVVKECTIPGIGRAAYKCTKDKNNLHARLSRILSICADVCLGMAHLESLGLVHGHMTPSNILLDNRLNAKVLPLFTERVPRGLRDILERCFDFDPPNRPSFSHIYHFISRFHTPLP